MGENGIGKSTLLHAIAGTAPIVTGVIRVGGVVLQPRDLRARFAAGVCFVPQHSSLDGPLSALDARTLAYRARPGLENEAAIQHLLKSTQWFSPSGLSGRMFDLLTALLCVPRVLLLDEILAAFPEHERSSATYQRLRTLLPLTTVVFVDHDVRRATAVADWVLWLTRDRVPQFRRAADWRPSSKISGESTECPQEVPYDGSELDLAPAVRLDRSIVAEVRLALQASGLRRGYWKGLEEELAKDFGDFLTWREPAEVLSGGQRVILEWLITEVARIRRLPPSLLEHLSNNWKSQVMKWRSRLSLYA